MRAQVSFVLSQFTGLTDRWTDRHTYRSWLRPACIDAARQRYATPSDRQQKYFKLKLLPLRNLVKLLNYFYNSFK